MEAMLSTELYSGRICHTVNPGFQILCRMWRSLELCLLVVCWLGSVIIVSATPEIKTKLEQASQDVIFTDAVTTVTTEITFNDVVTSDVKFDIYTSLDVLDMIMKKPARVKIGPNLHMTGSILPEYDAEDSYSYPGIMSYSASFDLGNVTMKTNPTGGRHVPGNNSIIIQYEAVVPKERMRITDGEHIHSYGVVFEYGGAEEKNVFVCESKAKFVDRKPMTLLYRALTKTFPEAGLSVKEMAMPKDQTADQPPKPVSPVKDGVIRFSRHIKDKL